ncbi:MAG TPA: sterol desaturase family protein [Spirochaetia bacterium]|nr:sterol desaturase family protein [Spirochaetia bacterium]
MPSTSRYGAEPIRLFKSDFLEFFSHVKPVTVLALWCPVTLFFLYDSLAHARGTLDVASAGLGILSGWFVWTLVEYFLHRFFFHYHPKTERFRRVFFLAHGVHHAQPLCRTRLVMPPVISIPLGIVFFGVFRLVFDVLVQRPQWFSSVFAGFIIGYIVYDMMHYNLHHSKVKNAYILMCRRQHMQHHGTCPTMRFGVSSPVWDYVFGTMPKGLTTAPAAAPSPTPVAKNPLSHEGQEG